MVQLSCGVRCTRAILFSLNIVFLLIGLSVMSVGIYIKVNNNFRAISEIYSISESLGGEAMQWVGLGLIILGVFTALLAAFGCLGAVCSNRCFLYVYAILLSLIILLELGAIISTLVFRKNLEQSYDSGFMEIFHHACRQNNSDVLEIIEKVEREFQCCGVDGASDYLKFSCKMPRACFAVGSPIPYSQGCSEAVITWLGDQLPLIVGALSGILVIELFGIIASLVLGVAISHSSDASYYQKL